MAGNIRKLLRLPQSHIEITIDDDESYDPEGLLDTDEPDNLIDLSTEAGQEFAIAVGNLAKATFDGDRLAEDLALDALIDAAHSARESS